MARTSFVFLLLACWFVLVACGTQPERNETIKPVASPGEAASGGQNSLEAVKASGKLRIGTEGTYAPFTYHDENGKLVGFDVEIAEEISKRIGVEAEFVETPWDEIFAGLDAKQFDVIFNQVSIREDRLEQYSFSDPYIYSHIVLIVKQDNTDIKKLSDLYGKKAAQSLTSNLLDIAQRNGAEIVPSQGFYEAISLLLSGEVDATVNDGLTYLDLKHRQPEVPLKIVDEMSEATASGALFTKGHDELILAVNQALADMKKDGTYLEISTKYFDTDVSR
ncbi:cystine transport system substrate-binding protein [Paenibacillus algorifonticola]|uniref:Cystine transport system substrate-binding protein n=1 Tax=Paenibacillus algorifonticola TaxID=684063 RepID=A0A1I2ELM1_9BACL|nr:amino acid ABC transporter substrate-binding protein [Paenibacillus algorifonticola]SFE93507.1 cystine transport system substrate-binding protein [Paenibacillus algorifonticola]